LHFEHSAGGVVADAHPAELRAEGRQGVTLTPQQRGLVIAGALLFLLGLLQGAVIPNFSNPRMALSAHLTAVQCGMALMIVGLVWPAVSLSEAFAKTSRLIITTGFYGLWLGLTLSAATGASQTLPIAGVGHSASGSTELFVSAIVLGSSGLIILGWVMFIAGLLVPVRMTPAPRQD
jgi:(hydroxyamino)benzene mutase